MGLKKNKLIIGITAPQSIILLKGQLKYFSEKGYEVFLLAPKTESTENFCKSEKAELLPVNLKREIHPLKDMISLIQIFLILKKIKPDIVNFGTPKVSLLGLFVAKIIGVEKRFYTCRGFRFEHESGLFRKFLVFLEKFTAYCAKSIICISPSVRSLGVDKKVFDKTKSLVINKGSSNGLNLEMFNSKRLNSSKTLQLKIENRIENVFTFGYLGRIIKRKGFIELFEAFERFYNHNENTQLLVVGRPYYDQIEKEIVEKVAVHPGVKMVGLVPYEETPYFFSMMDVFTLPAYWEGFGNVLIQAAAMGLPIISTDVTGCKDAVSDGYNGLLVSKKDSDGIYRAMVQLYNDNGLRKKLGSNGLKWSKNFDSKIVWSGLYELYNKEIL